MPAHVTLAESVAAALRHAILQGAYVCGERLVELTIAHEMNVSQNTVRDALRLLEQDGLVVKRARYGTHVRTYTPEEVVEIYALWAAVEGIALQWAAARISPDQMIALRQLLHHFQDHRGVEQRFRLHTALVDYADRPLTADLLRALHYQARLLENLRPPRGPQQQAAQVAVYAALLDALARRDADGARQVLGDHLASEGRTLAAVIAERRDSRV